MNTTSPAAQTPGDIANTLVALDAACAATDTPEQIRAILKQARDLLAAVHQDAEAARIRYQSLFDAVPDPVSVIAWDGTVLDLNRAGTLAYRRPREEVVGQPIHVLNPDLPRDHMIPVWERLSQGDTYVIEVTNRRSDGTRFPVEVHSAAFRQDGRECIVAVARDLSKRHDAEQRYLSLMESIDTGIVVQDAAGVPTFANAAAMRMLGIVDGQSLTEALDPAAWLIVDADGTELDATRYPGHLAIAQGSIVRSTVIGLHHRARRTLKWLSVTAVPQFAPDGDVPVQVLSMFQDITALKRENALFARAQALAGIGGWELDTARGRLYLTEGARRIFGRDPAPRSLADWLDGLQPADRERLRLAIEQACTGTSSIDLDLRMHRDDGQRCWVRVIGESPTLGVLQARIIGTVQDITASRHQEDTLRARARIDPLTGLLNRDAILQSLTRRMDETTDASVAVLYVDLDRFKAVNDAMGHAAGDCLLIEAAQRIGSAVDDSGIVARIGGDEFLVVCAGDPTIPETIATRMVQAFADPFVIEGTSFDVTASVGIACAPHDGNRAHALVQAADIAMYDSKRRGRNAWRAYRDMPGNAWPEDASDEPKRRASDWTAEPDA